MELDFEIVLDELSFDKAIPIRIDRIKQLDYLSLRQNVKDDEVQLSYIEFEPSTIQNTISRYYPYNKFLNLSSDSFIVKETSTFDLDVKKVRITNRAKQVGGESIPLFYGMVLPIGSINIKVHGEDVSKDFFYEIDESAGVIYSNKKNDWNEKTLEYKPIYVSYFLEDVFYKKVFTSSSVFKEVTVYDIDPVTFTIPANRTVYSVSRTVLGKYHFEMNGSGPFYVQYLESPRLHVSEYFRGDTEEPWFLTFNLGKIDYRSDTINRKYSIREYESQLWYPYYPYQTINVVAEVIDKDKLFIKNSNIRIKPDENLNIFIEHRNERNELLKLYTTSLTHIGKPYHVWDYSSRDKIWESLSFEIDEENSIVICNNSIPFLSTDKVYVKCTVIQESFTYTKLNLNPRFNKRINDHIYLLYLKPDLEAGERSLHHLELTKSGKSGSSALVITDYTDRALLIPNGTEFNEWAEENMIKNLVTGELSELDTSYLLPIALIVKKDDKFKDYEIVDIRLKEGFKGEDILNNLRKHPSLYWTSKYSNDPIEYPERFFVSMTINNDDILTTKHSDVIEAIETHLAVGTSYTFKQKARRPRVKEIYTLNSEDLTVVMATDRPETEYYLYELRSDSINPDIEFDTLIHTWDMSYNSEEVTVSIDISDLPAGLHKFYVISSLNNVYSSYGDVFKVSKDG